MTLSQNERRLLIHFPDRDSDLPRSRPTGRFIAGPWYVEAENLDDIVGVTEHRCHFLWNIFTDVYP